MEIGNIKIENGIISGICGDASKSVLTKDFIYNNIPQVKGKIGYIGDTDNYRYQQRVKDEIEFQIKCSGNYFSSRNRPLEALKLLGLDSQYLYRNPNNLSTSEQKKIMLSSVVACNPDTIILDDFEKGLNIQSKKEIRLILTSLNKNFGKTIILISNDLLFLSTFCHKIYVINNQQIALEGGKEIFDNNLLFEYVEMPLITEFIKYMNSLNHKFKNYNDVKDLLKAVYRSAK